VSTSAPFSAVLNGYPLTCDGTDFHLGPTAVGANSATVAAGYKGIKIISGVVDGQIKIAVTKAGAPWQYAEPIPDVAGASLFALIPPDA